MATDFRVGGVSAKAFDIDADGNYLFLAVKDTGGQPQILKMLADLSANAAVSYNPGLGDEICLMAGDYSPYWVWAAGNFGSTERLVQTVDGGNYWYVKNPSTWTGTARPILVGPGDDGLVSTSERLSFLESYYEGEYVYWTSRTLPGTIWAIDRLDTNVDDVGVGSYWYTGDSAEIVYFSPNAGGDWENITDALSPPGTVTALIIG